MATRTNRFLWSVGLGLGFQFLTTVTNLWLQPFLLPRVGQDTLGVWAMAQQAMTYLILFDLGISTLLPREIAQTTGRAGEADGSRHIRDIVGRYAWFVIWQTLLVAAVSAGIFAIFAHKWGPAAGPISWLVTIYVAIFPFRLFSGILSGLQDLRFLGFVQMAAYFVNVSLCITLVLAGWGLGAIVAGWAAQMALGGIGAALRVVLRHRNLLTFPTRQSFRRTARMFYDGGWTITGLIGTTLIGATDAMLIGTIIGLKAILPFTYTIKLVAVLGPMVVILTSSILPGLSQLREKATLERLATVYTAYTQTVLLWSGWMGCVIVAVSKGFVAWWMGAGFFLGDSVVWWAVLTMNLRHWCNGFAVTLFCCNREKPLWLITLFDGLATFGLTALIIWVFGPAYVPLGSLAGVAIISLPLNYLLIRSEVGLTVKQIAATLGWWVVRYVLALAGVLLLREFWQPVGFTGLAALGIIVSAVYLAIMVPRALRAEVGEYLRPRLHPLLNRLRRVRIW